MKNLHKFHHLLLLCMMDEIDDLDRHGLQAKLESLDILTYKLHQYIEIYHFLWLISINCMSK